MSPSRRFFLAVTARSKAVLAAGIATILGCGAFVPLLTKDPGVRALMPPDLPAVAFREEVHRTFGLEDPLVVAVMSDSANGVFEPETLALIDRLTDQIGALPGVNPGRIKSLATESYVVGSAGGVEIRRFFDTPPATQAEANRVRDAALASRLARGRLVSRDGKATLIAVELLSEKHSRPVYERIAELVAATPTRGEKIHVAGEAAVSGYLGAYIDSDVIRLNALVAVVLTIVLFLAFRSVPGVLLPHFVVLGATAAALGGMAASGVPYYVITSSLTVIVVSVSVADAIHILGDYYDEVVEHPEHRGREAAVLAMERVWRPVIATSTTDVAGFMALGFASFSPAVRAFGAFAALGATVALVFSVFCVPAALTVLRPGPPRLLAAAAAARDKSWSDDRYSRAMQLVGRFTMARPRLILALGAAVSVAGLVAVRNLVVNEAHVENFRHSEPVYVADRAINEAFDGTYNLDVVIETGERDGLLKPENLKRIEGLQRFLETLPHVKGSISIVDHLKVLNQSVHGGGADAARLPDSADVAAQYLLLYSSTGDPEDLASFIDPEYRTANVRATMDSGLFSDHVAVVEAAQPYVDEHFAGPGVRARLGGTVNMEYHFVGGMFRGHFQGVFFALVTVWVMAVATFRSVAAGAYVMIPAAFAILLNYAAMAVTGMWLSVATSMFAAITIGLGVDFALHTIDRLQLLLRDGAGRLEDALAVFYTSTARTLLFDVLCVSLGFSVLFTSLIPPIAKFGLLIFVSVAASFVASVTILPALVLVARPAFLDPERLRAQG